MQLDANGRLGQEPCLHSSQRFSRWANRYPDWEVVWRDGADPIGIQVLDPVDIVLTEEEPPGPEPPAVAQPPSTPTPPTMPGIPTDWDLSSRTNPDIYVFRVPKEDGIARPLVPGPVYARIKVINQCSWPQLVRWDQPYDSDTVAPGAFGYFQGAETRAGLPEEPGTVQSAFDHKATRVVGGTTYTCAGSGTPSWLISWRANPNNMSLASHQVLDPVDIVLRETVTMTPTVPPTPVPPATAAPFRL